MNYGGESTEYIINYINNEKMNNTIYEGVYDNEAMSPTICATLQNFTFMKYETILCVYIYIALGTITRDIQKFTRKNTRILNTLNYSPLRSFE